MSSIIGGSGEVKFSCKNNNYNLLCPFPASYRFTGGSKVILHYLSNLLTRSYGPLNSNIKILPFVIA